MRSSLAFCCAGLIVGLSACSSSSTNVNPSSLGWVVPGVGSYFVNKVSDTANTKSALQTLTITWHGSRDGKSNVILYSDSLGQPIGLVAYESNGDVSHCKIQGPDTSQVHWLRYPSGGGGPTYDTTSVVYRGASETTYESSTYVGQEQIALQSGSQSSIRTDLDVRYVNSDSTGIHQGSVEHGTIWWVPSIGFMGRDNVGGSREEIVAYVLH